MLKISVFLPLNGKCQKLVKIEKKAVPLCPITESAEKAK